MREAKSVGACCPQKKRAEVGVLTSVDSLYAHTGSAEKRKKESKKASSLNCLPPLNCQQTQRLCPGAPYGILARSLKCLQMSREELGGGVYTYAKHRKGFWWTVWSVARCVVGREVRTGLEMSVFLLGIFGFVFILVWQLFSAGEVIAGLRHRRGLVCRPAGR